MESNKILKSLVTLLLYPAVLGAIIYNSLENDEWIINNIKNFACNTNGYIFIGKMILFATTIVFYSCDFLYTLYTVNFRKIYFVYDFVILSLLFQTAKAVNFANNNYPNINCIVVCYIIFMGIYCMWDGYELYLIQKKDEEYLLYKNMVLWEAFSLIFMITLRITLSYSKSPALSIIISSFIILGSTAVFAKLVKRKSALFPTTEQ